MREYQPFPISNSRVGFDEAVEPWLLPRDGYQVMINAHLYRGVLEKIGGYNLFANFTNRVIASIGTPDGVTTLFTGTLPSVPVSSNATAYGTIIAGSTAEIFTYNGDFSTVFLHLTGNNGGAAIISTIDGSYSITFGTAPPSGTYSSIFFIYDAAPAAKTAIMGIKQYFTIAGGQQVLVFDQKRVGTIQNNLGIAASNAGALQVVSEIPHDYFQHAVFTGNGAIVTFVSGVAGVVAVHAPFVPGTLFFTEYTSTGVPTGRVITDTGTGGFTGTGIASGAVNYVTGAYTITFSVAPANGNYFDSTVGIYGDLFTGTISNFFSLTNYQFKAFFCNNVDPIFYYDGISVHYLNTSLSTKVITSSGGVPTFGAVNGYDISKCLHVFTNRERLLLISVVVDGVAAVSTIFWSTAGAPLNFTNNEFLQAPTSQAIRAIGYINSDLIIRFATSERVFRYTGDAISPFRFDSTNGIWACDAPYSTINYDSWFSSIGRPAITRSDGVNVDRADDIIPDFTDPYRLNTDTPVPFMSQTSIQQCYGERFDDLKEGWLCYNSTPTSESMVTPSDNILAFNYLDQTYAVYSFPFSCLGYGTIVNTPTWGTIFTDWDQMRATWDSYLLNTGALIDLAGDQFDKVYELNSGNTQTLAGDATTTPTPVLMDVISKNFNPFIEQGQLCRFGYVDLLVTANQESTLRIQFYLNDELYIDSMGNPAGFYQETMLRFTTTDAMSPVNEQVKVWKRIYVGAVGKEHTVRFYQNSADFTPSTLAQPIYIHAMVLYMKPAGRIFN